MTTFTTTQSWKQAVRAYTRRTAQRQLCEVCGSRGSEAHHIDYDKPLEITWLCRAHHMDQHNDAERSRRYRRRKGEMKTRGKRLLTPRQVADLLQVQPRTVTRWCRDGRIQPCRKLGRVWRIGEDFVVKEA